MDFAVDFAVGFTAGFTTVFDPETAWKHPCEVNCGLVSGKKKEYKRAKKN